MTVSMHLFKEFDWPSPVPILRETVAKGGTYRIPVGNRRAKDTASIPKATWCAGDVPLGGF